MIKIAKYTPRLKAPDTKNKYYIHADWSGYNSCIHIKNGSVLPNCVGYAWGRWYEILKKKPSLSRRNAEMWYDYVKDGYKRGKTPKIGAIICWKCGQANSSTDGAGHVAVVEQIKNNTDIITSNSAYGSTRWYLKELKPPYNFGKYEFQGFIYPPVAFEEEKNEVKYKPGNYRVTADLLNVRTGPGTNYKKKTYKELTKNAQTQIYKIAGYKANGYVKGVEFTAYEIKGSWGRTPSGYVHLGYCKKI